MDRLSEVAKLPDPSKSDYVERVNRVLDHIHHHLGGELTLEALSKVAHFSPYHFHRIFKSLLGETIKEYTQRVRLERALYLLSHANPPTLTDVALACGFAASSDFSRAFRRRYGVPPSQFDVASYRRQQRDRLQDLLPEDERHLLAKLPPGENPDGFVVDFVEAPPRRVAYLRVDRPFEPGRVTDAAERLVTWAQERDLAAGQWLGYMWDDPEIVELELCRYDVAVEVPADLRPRGEVGVFDFPAMRLAQVELAGSIDLEQRAIDWLYHTWLPASGFVPDHQPAFEAWKGLPFAHGHTHFELAFQLAVVREGPLG